MKRNPREPWRVAFLRVAQETNGFSKCPTTLEDFQRAHWLEGPALLQATKPGGYEARGYIRNAELSGFMRAVAERPAGEVAPQPLLSAWAVPGGPLTRDTLDAILERIDRGLRYMAPVDGVFVSLHGAMSATGAEDPEAEILERVRSWVGEDVPIVVTVDLHAQITPRKLACVDALVAYQTNPHRDHAATGRKAGRLLLDLVRGEARATTAWRSLPILLGGGSTIDLFAPMRAVHRLMKKLEGRPGVRAVSLCTGHLWYTGPNPGWTVVVVTDGDAALAERTADELAEAAWAARVEPPPEFWAPSAAVAEIRAAKWARRLGTVCVCDASDVVGAGAPGENTRLLAAFLEEAPELRVLVPVRDAEAVARCAEARVGDRLALSIGGRFDPEMSPPMPVEGELLGVYEMTGIGRAAVLRVGEARVVLTEGPPLSAKPAFFREVGLSPWRADAVVVKSLFPFHIYFAREKRRSLYVRTRGVTDLDLGLESPHPGPLYPRDPIDDWRDEDRRRRGLAELRTLRPRRRVGT